MPFLVIALSAVILETKSITTVLDPSLREEYFVALAADGVPLFNLSWLHQWLHNSSYTLLHLITAIEVLAGSPSWGTQYMHSVIQDEGLVIT